MTSKQNIQLSAEDILKKEFSTKLKGYDQEEVNSYLDIIISDYEYFNQIIDDQQKQISELQEEIKNSELRDRQNPYENLIKTETTNVSMIQRISTLERKVYALEQRLNMNNQTY